jgi:hypothetical protein
MRAASARLSSSPARMRKSLLGSLLDEQVNILSCTPSLMMAEDETHVVSAVVDGSISSGRLHVGDQVVMVNNMDSTAMPFNEVVQQISASLTLMLTVVTEKMDEVGL